MPAKPIETVALVSLGCPKNLVDSERMLGLLAEDGLAVTGDLACADAIVINTCGFLEASKIESIKEIRDAVRLKEQGVCQRVIVAGCLVQRHKTQLIAEVPGIDRLVGVFDREHVVAAVRGKANADTEHGHFLGKYHQLSRKNSDKNVRIFEDDRSRFRLTPRHFAYLRVSEGCNQGCTFCTIPSIRGPMRSKPIDQIMAEARELAADGAVELNLIGQDTTSYGTDISYVPGLSGLLAELDKNLPDVHWLRLMYAYPSCFTDAMIRTIASCERVLPYIDMPLQHVNDEILARMHRRVTRKEIEILLGKLRDWIPGITIRTTFIAGSPGETQAQHEELVRFVKEFGFDMMGVFPYSREDGTAMGRREDQLADNVKQARVEELMLAQQEIAFAKARSMCGKTITVMVERPTDVAKRTWLARGKHQAPDIDSSTTLNAAGLHPGQILDVRVTDCDGYDLIAEMPRKKSRSLAVIMSYGTPPAVGG